MLVAAGQGEIEALSMQTERWRGRRCHKIPFPFQVRTWVVYVLVRGWNITNSKVSMRGRGDVEMVAQLRGGRLR